ncbi:ABC transporter ATP-binding protein [Clostridium tyrobutyricum]|uniref:ABC transporter ATP-binding protein n=1 Tax=Clostridium tyrobutyricum TaxID=1519 RepID=UPI001C38FCAD|nr:ABC transporter ATP-binding protein [Clostridium tyrobutyricum]MBV4443363.1 ABC transporter ATP-binding protein [Clostridium tyrobutyricum]
MTNTAIEFLNVSKRFPNASKYSVENVNIRIKEGDFITILGTSGSGKTTLLKTINRIYETTSGDILFFGKNIKELDLDDYRRKIGYVIQQIGLFPHMTIEQNIATVPQILKWDKNKIDKRIDYLLNLVNLSPKDFRKRYPRQLSGGQQQRVGIARAMAADPSVMLMDEPFGAIDAITRQNLQDELIKIQKELNKTILFVTHDINEAFKLGDKIIIMNDGKIQQFDTAYNILFNPANDYVAKLVSSDNILQRLKLLKAESIMVPVDSPIKNTDYRVGPDETLDKVLSLLLENNTEYIVVENKFKKIEGKISLEQLRRKSELK